ncbi:MAG: hypothetical protein JXA50_03405 [Deltaproteobacteria bacterium]|nr:hypothetical protein [Deltaproteobacteria bacterium]
MKLKSKHIAPMVLAFFIIGIAGTMLLNLWSTELGKVPAQYQSGEFEGEYDPSDIRGSYTFEDISKAFEIPVEDLAKAFGFTDTPDPNIIKAKDLEETYGSLEQGELGTDSIRLFVAFYKGLPFMAEEKTLIPRLAVSILKEKANLTEEQKTILKERTISLSELRPSETEGEAQVATEHETTEEFVIKGNTTFQELLDFGITQEEIEKIFGMPMGKPGEALRDYATNNGVEFSEFKAALEALVASKKQ